MAKGWPKGKKRGPRKPETVPMNARVEVTQRQETELNHRQECFVMEYMKDHNPGAAYIRAGYEVKEDVTAEMSGRRLLRDFRVMSLLNNAQLRRIEKTGMDADSTVLRFHHLYMEALRQGDLSVAGKMLAEMAKIMGLYEKHNKQKQKYSMEDIDRLKAELKQSGFDIDQISIPSPN